MNETKKFQWNFEIKENEGGTYYDWGINKTEDLTPEEAYLHGVLFSLQSSLMAVSKGKEYHKFMENVNLTAIEEKLNPEAVKNATRFQLTVLINDIQARLLEIQKEKENGTS